MTRWLVAYHLPYITLTYAIYGFCLEADQAGLVLRDLALFLRRGFDWSIVGVFITFLRPDII